jgi:hypothetical protein
LRDGAGVWHVEGWWDPTLASSTQYYWEHTALLPGHEHANTHS